MATCGRTETLTLTGATISNVSVFNVVVSKSAVEIDTTALGSNVYGTVTVCGQQGTLTVDSYTAITGTATGYSIAGESGNCVLTGSTTTIDAKGVDIFQYTYRLID